MKRDTKWTLMVKGKAEGFWSASDREETEILYIKKGMTKSVRFTVSHGKIQVFLLTEERETPLILEGDPLERDFVLELIWRGYRTELWIDGLLADEEWPEGNCLEEGGNCWYDERFLAETVWIPEAKEKEFVCTPIENAQYWAPKLGKNNVGDCMPFADGDVYHLFYLKDRRQHKSKWGKGAHQFAHISTKDMIHWEEHPTAVEITHPWEGSICTGSVIKKENLYYAFYAVRMMDGSSAKVSFATSTDAVHFIKSEKYFTLSAPYETTSVRDPEVFYGADGQYHMFLTTNWEAETVKERNGCLAHLVSADLENWEEKEPFLIPGYTDQPECSDYFEWNGWYYLIFSNYGTAKYRYSRHPFGPWICPEQEMIDGLLYRVPKTAAFGNRRIASGFLCIHTAGESYAGNLVLRELVQKEDGTLGTCLVKEVLPLPSGQKETICLDRESAGGYCEQAWKRHAKYAKIRMQPEEKTGSYGILLTAGENTVYELRIEPALQTVGIYPAHSNLYYHPTKRILTGVKGLEQETELELVLMEDILDLCINGTRTLVCRMEESWKGEADGITGCFVKDGKVMFEIER